MAWVIWTSHGTHKSCGRSTMRASPWLGLGLEGSLLFPWHKPKLQTSMEHLGFSIALGWGVGVEHKGSEMLASRIVQHPVARGGGGRAAEDGLWTPNPEVLMPKASISRSFPWMDGCWEIPTSSVPWGPQSITGFPLAPTTFLWCF